MTFSRFRRARPTASNTALSRGKIRSLLKKGRGPNPCAFTQAGACYIEFLSEYFYLLGFTSETDRLEKIRSTLFQCWRFAPYIRRVSDLERFLKIQLEKSEGRAAPELQASLGRVESLDSTQRFLLVARYYQNWSYRALHLSTRIRKSEVSHALAKVKCALVGFDYRELNDSDWALMVQVNDLLEGELRTKEARVIEKAIRARPFLLKFKADWLQFRCALAETKSAMMITPDTVEQFKEQLTVDLGTIPIKQPKLSETLINQISFTRIPSS